MCKPFVKWVGGKTQLLSEIRTKYPQKFKKYCEPFVGGGAVLFDVLDNYDIKEVLINDLNEILVNTYRDIKNNVDELIGNLKDLDEEYNSVQEIQREKIYYHYRDVYNKLINDKVVNVKSSSLFIFLNKTCFNGLYRVNAKGLFNVPKGIYKKPLICDEENLNNISNKLKNVEIRCGDFAETINFIDKDTFVYIDPPYRPLTNTSSFTSYNANDFNDEEQLRLRDFINKINAKGAKVVLSNSDPKNTDEEDDFFDNIYSKYNINRVFAKRCINSNSSKRGNISELLISNY